VEKVLSFGGFATVPVVLAAWVCRVPVTLFEQNAIPGRANRGLAFFSQRVCLALQGSESYFNGKAVLVGNPVRSSYERDDVLEEVLGLRWKLGRRCLVFGGSQGAEALNMFIASEYGFFSRQSIQVIHVVGEAYYKAHFLDAPYYVGEEEDGIGYVVLPYIKNMKRAYEWADYVISRSGATTVAELQYFKKQALLVPYPYAKDNHQVANAQVLCDDDSAISDPRQPDARA
jgi:UDP-N-acetylglucosamine--N-acetylmuramyl-(pentapeptide) pyrophosphoryl-undecaprenol N-acetylglucosamine transferase